MTASEMGKASAKARRKKYGGKKGFSIHMSRVRRAALNKKSRRREIQAQALLGVCRLELQGSEASQLKSRARCPAFSHLEVFPPLNLGRLYFYKSPVFLRSFDRRADYLYSHLLSTSMMSTKLVTIDTASATVERNSRVIPASRLLKRHMAPCSIERILIRRSIVVIQDEAKSIGD
jgi:hypothetical protein